MSVMTRRMCCPLPWAPAQTETTPAPAGDLGRRYLDGDEHQRLCLWLQHREARAELTRLEARQPARAQGCFAHLRRWLGLPGV